MSQTRIIFHSFARRLFVHKKKNAEKSRALYSCNPANNETRKCCFVFITHNNTRNEISIWLSSEYSERAKPHASAYPFKYTFSLRIFNVAEIFLLVLPFCLRRVRMCISMTHMNLGESLVFFFASHGMNVMTLIYVRI